MVNAPRHRNHALTMGLLARADPLDAREIVRFGRLRLLHAAAAPLLGLPKAPLGVAARRHAVARDRNRQVATKSELCRTV